MSTIVEQLGAPAAVWEYFAEICTVPHGSGNTEALCDHLHKKFLALGFECIKDDVGNLVIIKEADEGFEKAPCVCLQGHLDMVCTKSADSTHNFETDPIKLRIDGDWLLATGTTL
ncbi:peptidase M20C, Xaa-His dipeptidase, partial [Kipferlia bialata]|eukprot:g13095.t1